MRTAREVLEKNVGHAIGLMDASTIYAMKEYALEVAKEALKNASVKCHHFQQVILSETNIPELK